MDNRVSTTLQSVFGFSSFKNNQEEIVTSILNGTDVFAAMPTGGGKSLCYQLPALFFQDQLTIVISPLLALINDLFACEVPYFCPHGRPLIIKMTMPEFEKKFKRTI